MTDHTLRNSYSKGHNVNGMRKTFWLPRGRPVLRKKTCACTRTYRCPKHINGGTP